MVSFPRLPILSASLLCSTTSLYTEGISFDVAKQSQLKLRGGFNVDLMDGKPMGGLLGDIAQSDSSEIDVDESTGNERAFLSKGDSQQPALVQEEPCKGDQDDMEHPTNMAMEDERKENDTDAGNEIESAEMYRLEGKRLHDISQFAEAADCFAVAANLVLPKIQTREVNSMSKSKSVDIFATCRMHQALCLLKAGRTSDSVNASSDVIDLLPAISPDIKLAPTLRARALHRRAKAQIALCNRKEALEDARLAAYLGDMKAVKLYGKLMRDRDISQYGSSQPSEGFASNHVLETLGIQEGMAIRRKRGRSKVTGRQQTFATSSQGMGSFAMSTLSSIAKGLEDETMQQNIAKQLRETSSVQLQQLASMAGLQMSPRQSETLARWCSCVTPKAIRWVIQATKIAFYTVHLVRKITQLLSRYRGMVVLALILGWSKSAISRPLPKWVDANR